MTATAFAFDGFRGEAGEGLASAELVGVARRLLDPAAAEATLHWGRNYLYLARVETAGGPLAVAVKQFRERGPRARLGRRLRGEGKAARSWRVARALAAAGISTPEPLLYVEPVPPGAGPALYVCRHLAGRLEARYLLRARNAGREGAEFPAVEFGAFLAAAAELARRLHDAGFWHRDFSAGNLLIAPGERPAEIRDLALVDLNRCRRRARVGLAARMRDLARLPLERAEDRRRLLELYFAPRPPAATARLVYELARHGFHGRHRAKTRGRARLAGVRAWLVPRGVHAHIPPPPAGAGARDRIVWDALSDQPHSHASRWARARVRAADLPDHLRAWGAAARALPRARRCLYARTAAGPPPPFGWPGAGVGLRPRPEAPGELLAAFDELGLRQALLRLHPWQARHDDELELARALAARGVELTFTLPQSRELVRDPVRWRAAIEELAERFLPYGRRFQIGQAVNRSKWGIWRPGEYLELAAAAAGALRGRGAVELAGPAVIDFEPHVTAGLLNCGGPQLRFDALASLLYVDRRGAPENRQLGYDTAGKVALLSAIGETARRLGNPRQWITEVNWPLREGPYAPAGRHVAVDEPTQADYLVRFYLAALGGGAAERVFWWQLAARGYGLLDVGPGGLRRRPAFHALATLERQLAGAACLGPAALPAGARGWRFAVAGGERWVVWSLAAPLGWRPPGEPAAVVGRDGEERPGGAELLLTGSPCYLTFAGAPPAASAETAGHGA